MKTQNTATTPMQSDSLLRIAGVEQRVGLKKSTIYKLMSEGKFPRCIKFSARCSVWSERAVSAWVQSQVAAGTDEVHA
jgi:predicted DNA-binding transcriptional regulator AlpA